MTRMTQFIEYRALAHKFSNESPVFTALLDNALENETAPIPVQNVCAKLALPLVERLERTLATLNMSKRQFIQLALVEALDKADAIMAEVLGDYEEGADHE